MNRLTGSVFAGSLAIAMCTWQATAAAAGFATQTFGGEHGSVVETNPTALYYNPGALGFSSTGAVGMYGSLAVHGLTWTHSQAVDDLPDPAGAKGADTGKASLLNVFGGAAIGGTVHVTKNLVIGAGFFAPFFGLSHWDQNSAFAGNPKYGQAVNGVQRWFGYDGKIEVLYFSAGAAYRLGPISIGATGNFISSTLANHQARNIGGMGRPNPDSEGTSYFDVQGYNGSFAAGLMVDALPGQVEIGASYQAQPGMGEQKLDGDLYIAPPGMSPTHTLVTLHQQLPDIVRAGIKVHPKSIPWEFRVFGDYTRWSVLKSQCLGLRGGKCEVADSSLDPQGNTVRGAPLADGSGGVVFGNNRRNWNDTFGVRVGASYWAQPAIELFAGAGYETAAVPDSTLAPDVPDAVNVQGTLGARFAVSENLFLTASYTHIQYLDRDDSKSTLETDTAGNQWVYPTVEGSGNGHYTQFAGVFTGNLEAIF
jgi:long-chain fatty acid transport protein